jgi:predicted DCC family thiol-disulfide oxidoreductase YuxK
MADSRAQARFVADGPHLVLYDGVCGLCNRLLQFLLVHDHRAVFRFASLQSATGQATVARAGGDPHALNSFYVFANYQTPNARLFARSSAALFVAGQLGWPWTAARLLGILPGTLLDRLYDLVAHSRYRIFGRLDRCPVPRPEHRVRFVD